MCCQTKPDYIYEGKPTIEVYAMLNAQLDKIEKTTIISDQNGLENARENSIDIGFKLFPILEFVSASILEKQNTRDYLIELGYTGFEADLIYSMFRNGLLHSSNPYHFEYNNGEISWGLMSSSGSGGFSQHFPGYKNTDDPSLNIEADKAFWIERLSDGNFHASLSLDSLVSQVRHDLKQRKERDKRPIINIVVGQRRKQNIPSTLTAAKIQQA